MRYVVATIGAAVMFVGVFIVALVIRSFFPQAFGQRIGIGPFWTNHILGVVLSPLAAYASFRGTLRHYRDKDLRRGNSNHPIE